MSLMPRATHVLQWPVQRVANPRGEANPIKPVPVRIGVCNSMKQESLVIAYQHDAVNTFPGLVHTARHAMEVGSAQSRWPNLREGTY